MLSDEPVGGENDYWPPQSVPIQFLSTFRVIELLPTSSSEGNWLLSTSTPADPYTPSSELEQASALAISTSAVIHKRPLLDAFPELRYTDEEEVQDSLVPSSHDYPTPRQDIVPSGPSTGYGVSSHALGTASDDLSSFSPLFDPEPLAEDGSLPTGSLNPPPSIDATPFATSADRADDQTPVTAAKLPSDWPTVEHLAAITERLRYVALPNSPYFDVYEFFQAILPLEDWSPEPFKLTPQGKPPRPSNSSLLFRSWYSKARQVAKRFKYQDRVNYKKDVAAAWNALEQGRRIFWETWGKKVVADHKRAFPGWKYKPARPGKGKGKARATSEASTRSSHSRSLSVPHEQAIVAGSAPSTSGTPVPLPSTPRATSPTQLSPPDQPSPDSFGVLPDPAFDLSVPVLPTSTFDFRYPLNSLAGGAGSPRLYPVDGYNTFPGSSFDFDGFNAPFFGSGSGSSFGGFNEAFGVAPSQLSYEDIPFMT